MSQRIRKGSENTFDYQLKKQKISKDEAKSTNNKESELLDKYKRVVILGDGNCLFRAILYALLRDDNSHLELRTLVCQE